MEIKRTLNKEKRRTLARLKTRTNRCIIYRKKRGEGGSLFGTDTRCGVHWFFLIDSIFVDVGRYVYQRHDEKKKLNSDVAISCSSTTLNRPKRKGSSGLLYQPMNTSWFSYGMFFLEACSELSSFWRKQTNICILHFLILKKVKNREQ